MSKTSKSESALFKYNQIRYSFVSLKAGEQYILTSDPWSFLHSNLRLRLGNSKGKNREKTERAIYYSELAEDFYKAAEVVPLPAKGTLLYYGMLNLVKCYLSLKDVPLEITHEEHGLNLPLGQPRTVKVKGKLNNAINVFFEFSNLLGKPVEKTSTIQFQEVLTHIPEIHNLYTNLISTTPRKFLPIDIEFRVNEKRNCIFTRIIFTKKQETNLKTEKFLARQRKNYFKDSYNDEQRVIYESRKRKSFSARNAHRVYKNILNEYRTLDIVPILTRQGYKYYVDLSPGELPHLCYTFLAMFYLGSAARYRPLELKSLLEDKLRPLISEFVSLSPKQFLYQIVSLSTGKECVIPHAAI